MPMTQENRNAYEQAYTEYTNRDGRFQGADQQDIRKVCDQARTWSAAPELIGPDAVHTLILAADNDVANVDRGSVPAQRTHLNLPPLDDTALVRFLQEVLHQASVSQTLTRNQYLRWQNSFFTFVGFHAWQVFNRLVFTCFPTQFCSVVDAERLRLVMNELVNQGLLDDFQVTTNNDAEWFDLCQLVVPVVQEAFPTRDYADHSTFLAAMGDALN